MSTEGFHHLLSCIWFRVLSEFVIGADDENKSLLRSRLLPEAAEAKLLSLPLRHLETHLFNMLKIRYTWSVVNVTVKCL